MLEIAKTLHICQHGKIPTKQTYRTLSSLDGHPNAKKLNEESIYVMLVA